MSVNEIMSKDVISIDGEKTVKDAARLMRDKGIGALVVLEKKKPVGIITEKDLASRVLAEGKPPTTPVKSIATKKIISIAPDAKIRRAVELMNENRIRRLVVMKNDDAVGIITLRDVIKNWQRLVTLLDAYGGIMPFTSPSPYVDYGTGI